MKTTRVATQNARNSRLLAINFVRWSSGLMFSIILLMSSCSKNEDMVIEDDSSLINNESIDFKSQSPNMVLAWNQAMQDLYSFSLNGPATPPVSASYTWALVHLAMHDALNSITPRYDAYVGVPRDKDANPDAAVAQAAYDVIMAINSLPFAAVYLPQNLASINALLTTSLDGIPQGPEKDKGIALGHAVAQAIMAHRSGDFPFLVPASPNQPPTGTQPGEYRYLPFAPAPNGMGYAFPNFGNLPPFFISDNDQFRTAPPYNVNSTEYAADYNETKDFGGTISTYRTPDQSEFGVFWAENSNRGWNELARHVLNSYNPQSQNAWKTARYLALVHSAIADAYISVFESKMHYYTWRPINAIQLADNDGNNDTAADPNWTPVLLTPPVGEYPSAHALTGAAAGQIIYRYFNNRDNYNIEQHSSYMPGVTRSFSKISDAIRENSLSRIYIGYHFRQAVEVGEETGLDLADYVYANALNEKP